MRKFIAFLWRSPWTPVGLCMVGAVAPSVAWWVVGWIAPALVLMAFGLGRHQAEWRDFQEAVSLMDLWRRQDARWK